MARRLVLYGWSGEAVRLIEDRLRGLKLRVPVEGLRLKLAPDASELDACRTLAKPWPVI